MSIQKTIAHSFDEMKSILVQFDDKMYQKELKIISDATIGQHFRHIIEFYDCFIKAQSTKIVSYDERQRNYLWETSVIESLNILNDLKSKINQLDLVETIALKQNYYGEDFTVKSTNHRELMYCFDHGIHHFALIKIALEIHFPSIKIPTHFGVASSTITFQNQEK
jgi:uncharacterized damage-inducible protein DinB